MLVLWCAQRLTASEIFLQLQWKTQAIAQKCSTPYGIRDFFTCEPNLLCDEVGVLNALRHQRFFYLFPLHFQSLAVWCSTPYGIRDFFTFVFFVILLTGMTVLNALRHQRFFYSPDFKPGAILKVCSTPYGIRDFFTKIITNFFVIKTLCSTPYGIRDFFTVRSLALL